MLKAVKHLSMNATLLDVLQNANALEILIRLLDELSAGPHCAVRDFLVTMCHQNFIFVNVGSIQSHIPNVLQPL
jgi:uncharacterized hydantoinase/oxoprolinase family protein